MSGANGATDGRNGALFVTRVAVRLQCEPARPRARALTLKGS